MTFYAHNGGPSGRLLARICNSGRGLRAFAALAAAALAPAMVMGAVVEAGGYAFNNFDLPGGGNAAGAGTNINGIANNGNTVGFSINDNGAFSNFVRDANGNTTPLNLNSTAIAFGINSAGTVVGQQNNAAFVLSANGTLQPLASPTGASTALGINDAGDVVGQYSSGLATPGFVRANGVLNTINAPSTANESVVNAQGINNNGLVVGFYVGNDGQDHGFITTVQSAKNGIILGTGVNDPKIPSVPGEPGATFVFSQILGVNDSGIVVGYYGDSTTSQHGFIYNTNTGVYTFLDDPSEQFHNGVEVTQITGINNLGEITGFYSDDTGVFHGFTACPVGSTCTSPAAVPEPASGILAVFGMGALGLRRCLGQLSKRG